jgi:hypothetical protein
MLARHPISEQPIKIIRTNPSISACNKTLVWIRDSFVKGDAWQRWFPVISEISALELVPVEKLTAIILTKDSNIQQWYSVLQTIHNDTLLLCSAKQLKDLSVLGFTRILNIFTIEDIYDSYPFLGSVLMAEDNELTLLFALAHILRMERVALYDKNYEDDVSWETILSGRTKVIYYAWKKALNGSVYYLDKSQSDNCIPRTWLIQQYFHHKSVRRSREIFQCLEKNISCPYIDNILLLNEEYYSEIPNNNKIKIINHPHRLTYYDVFKKAIEIIPKNDILIFSNSDIYFDESLLNLWRIELEKRRLFLALLRWEEDGSIFGPRCDSQDSWICARNCLDFNITQEEYDFPFGKPGCDNAITTIMMKHKFLVVNPAYTIKTHHLHSSNLRNYDPKDILYRPIYVYVEPSAIHSLHVLKSFDEYSNIPINIKNNLQKLMGESFSRSIESVNDTHLATCITMLQRNGYNGYSHNSNNLFSPNKLFCDIYNLKDGFATSSGLIYTFKEIWGGIQQWEQLWNVSKVDIFTPSIYVPRLLVYPIDTSDLTLSSWILNYLPRVYYLTKQLSNAGISVEFLVPQTNYIGEFLNDCIFDTHSITVTPILMDMNYFSADLWVVPPSATTPVTKEDIAILRSFMKEENIVEKGPIVTFCCDEEKLCNREWASLVKDRFFSDWVVHFVQKDTSPILIKKAFRNSNWIIGVGDSLDFMWYASPKTRIMEFQRIDNPSDKYIHLAGACGHTYILGGIIRGEPDYAASERTLNEIGKAVQKFGFHEAILAIRKSKDVCIPNVIIPSGKALSGVFQHCGDTFREMATMWGERNYVTINYTEESGYCWWEGIGNILLYDRPTSRWWNPNTPYQMALFGNCAPCGPALQLLKQSIWCFWPRSPRAVENIVEKGLVMNNWKERPILSLFLGKVENGIQRAARTGSDWQSCVELWSMPFDSTGSSYPYTQEQYLEKLCSSRFGLCLPGFGPKCNREIEYFATGCVPIVTPGVDMNGYLVPPIEGVHYLRARDPYEVKKVIENCSVEKWNQMSKAGRQWWKTYASVEGLFRLTWARIEQCRPYFSTGIPQKFSL